MSMFVLGGGTGGLGRSVVELTKAFAFGRDWCDVTSDGSVAAWAEDLLDHKDDLHILNLTGAMSSSMLHKGNNIDWLKMLQVNVLGNARLLRVLRGVFKERPGSTFTMVGSVTSELGVVGTGIYSASKSALEGLTRVAAHEFAPFARVNLLHLGYCDVGMIKDVPNHDALIASIPLKRLGTAEDVAEAWKFFINCKYVTGAIVNVNGGLA